MQVKVDGKQYTLKRRQFPLTVAYAITCHASQGITKERVIIDYTDHRKKKHALFSVPFSRAKTLDGVFLKSFKRSYVHCDTRVLQEYERLERSAQYQFQNTYLYDPYFFNAVSGQPAHRELKITYLNINALLHLDHLECLRGDHNLMSSDIMCIAETKLRREEDLNEDVSLKDFDVVQRIDNVHGMKSMGMVLYKRKSIELFPVQIRDNALYQGVVCHLSYGIVCFVYIHPKITSAGRTDLIDYFSQFSAQEKFISLIGDLNIRSEMGMDPQVTLTNMLEGLNVFSAFKSQTQDQCGQLDYVLMNPNSCVKYGAGSFKNVYSDHKSVFLRISAEDDVVTASHNTTQAYTEVGEECQISRPMAIQEYVGQHVMDFQETVAAEKTKTNQESVRENTKNRNVSNAVQTPSPVSSVKRPTRRNLARKSKEHSTQRKDTDKDHPGVSPRNTRNAADMTYSPERACDDGSLDRQHNQAITPKSPLSRLAKNVMKRICITATTQKSDSSTINVDNCGSFDSPVKTRSTEATKDVLKRNAVYSPPSVATIKNARKCHIENIDTTSNASNPNTLRCELKRIVRFDNSKGNNNCWLNCVMRALSYMLSLVPGENAFQTSSNPLVKSFLLYIKNIINMKNGGKLHVHERTVFVEEENRLRSLKNIFSVLIRDPGFDSTDQQDVTEGLIRILDVLQEQRPNGHTPFMFCSYEYAFEYTCNSCTFVSATESIKDNMIRVPVPERVGNSLQFDMETALMNTLYRQTVLNDSTPCSNPKCKKTGLLEKMLLTMLRQFLIVNILLNDSRDGKLPDKCIPLQQFEVNALDMTHKYKLLCIIEHLGASVTSGHYVIYFKKDDTWYRASDSDVEIVNLEECYDLQPYVCIYKNENVSH